MLESYSRLSQAILTASEAADKDKSRKAAALVVNSVGVMSTPKRTEPPTAFSEATDFLGNAIQQARDAKIVRAKDKATDAQKPETAKSLAELLARAAQEAE